MSGTRQFWALILAGGEGSRLRALTTRPCGTAVPKQFCSLRGGRSLLEDAVDRALHLSDPERTCAILAQQHQRWWSGIDGLRRLPQGNLIVQPRNCGTAIGILYSLLHIVARDADARIVLLPADHYVREEETLRRAVLRAVARVEKDAQRPILLGLRPDEIDTDLGYILPAGLDPLGGRKVARFIEKPGVRTAGEIIEAGGLWNTFITAASATALINLFLPRYAALVMEMQVIVSRSLDADAPAAGWPAIVDMYQRLPTLDFSRDLLEGQERALRVLPVPPCGWSDLGTPHRLGQALRRLDPCEYDAAVSSRSDYLNLAAQHAHMEHGPGGAGSSAATV